MYAYHLLWYCVTLHVNQSRRAHKDMKRRWVVVCQRSTVWQHCVAREARIAGSCTYLDKYSSVRRAPPSCLLPTGHYRETLGRGAPQRDKTYLFNLEVVGAQRLLDLLLRAARRLLHRAAEAVQHTLERELLHRELFIERILCPTSPLARSAPATSHPWLRRGPLAGFGGRPLSLGLRRPSRACLVRRGADAARSRPPRPRRRRSTKTRRGTASGMYGNAAPLRDR